MKIYTKTGDRGTTGLRGGSRISKGDQRMVTIGTIDELNAFLGWARTSEPDEAMDAVLFQVQNLLFDAGAALANPEPDRPDWLSVEFLELSMDSMEAELPPLRNFILPGGSELAARLHIGRTICRRAERELVALAEELPISDELVILLNRLSDWLFVAARFANLRVGFTDIAWKAHQK